MADNNTSRFRLGDASGRGSGFSMPSNDPLAELARLIGQNDPFAEADPRRDQTHPEQALQQQVSPEQASQEPSDLEHAYPEYAQPHAQLEQAQPEHGGYDEDEDQDQRDPGDHSERPMPEHLSADRPEPEQQSSEDLPPLLRFGAAPEAAQEHAEHLPPLRFASRQEPQPMSRSNWSTVAPPSDGYQQPPSAYQPSSNPYQEPSSAYQQPLEPYGLPPPIRPLPGFDTAPYPEPAIQPPEDQRAEQGAPDPLPSFLTSPGRQSHFAEQSFDPEPSIYPPQAELGAMPPPHDEFYDDAPQSGGRRKGLLTVAAVLVLAVVGTAGAFAYRNYFGGGGLSGPPPVIRANAEPSKVAPPAASSTASADPSAAKISYDRFADRGKDEKIVGREEKPIDQKNLAGTPPASSSAPQVRANASGNPPNTIGQTRAVRTVPITPNSNDMAMNSPSISPDSAMLQSPPARQMGNFPPPPASAPPVQQVESTPEAASRSTSQQRTASTARGRSGTSGTAPLSLSPDAADQSPPPSASAYRDANPPARQANAAPAPRTSNSSAAAGGRFHVQVSSQKSESDAESSYRSIQSKYSSVLNGQPHSIRRADLGTKGVYYRAMVGPFGTREQAVQLCSNLKSAGGDCVVQAN